MTTPITTAFLGGAHIHTPGFVKRLQDRAAEVRVKFFYDPDAERGNARAAEFANCAFVPDYASVLADPEVGSVVICAETTAHRELVTAAAAAGKAIFCEKPLGLGAKDAQEMAQAIERAGVLFQTGFFQRGSPQAQFIKQEVAAGHLGKITRARYSNCHQAALAGWFDTDWQWIYDAKRAGGGAFLDLGAHPLDLIVNTFPATEGEVVNAQASLGNRGGRYGTTIDEYGTGLLTFASGAIVTLEASWVDPELRSGTEVFGTEGQIQTRGDELFYYSKHVDGADGKTAWTALPPTAPHAFELFWDALLGKPLPIPLVTVQEAATGSALMERLYHSAGRSTTEGVAG